MSYDDIEQAVIEYLRSRLPPGTIEDLPRSMGCVFDTQGFWFSIEFRDSHVWIFEGDNNLDRFPLHAPYSFDLADPQSLDEIVACIQWLLAEKPPADE